MDQNNPSTAPKPGILMCYMLDGVCVALANGHNPSRRMSAPTNNPLVSEIFNILAIKDDQGLGVEIHFVNIHISPVQQQN